LALKQCLTTVLLCTAVSFNVLAGDPSAGEAKAAICASCHGPAGNSVNPEWPKLAGQHAKYTAKQIRDFKAGVTRNNALMAPMIAGLSDQDIEDIAAYYAAQSGTGGFASKDLHALGERIYRGGNMESGVPACIACHGPRGAGNDPAGFPRVAGQHATYTAMQIEDWRAENRANDPNEMMADAVRYLTPREVKAVSEYIAGLH
jgi:cytochrome c553